MTWWNDFVAWFNSADGARVFYGAIIPFVAIVIAGLVAAAIGRGSARRVLAHQDRELKGAAIQALIIVGRKAAIWSSLGSDEKQHIDSLMSESDIRVRLLPVVGAGAAADWAAHELSAMKKNSAAFSFQAEQTFFDYRDRLLDWQLRPNRARKLFASDLTAWSYEADAGDKALVSEQQEWATAHTEPPRTASTAVSLNGATPTGLIPTVATPTAATPTVATPTTTAAAPAATAVTPAVAAQSSAPPPLVEPTAVSPASAASTSDSPTPTDQIPTATTGASLADYVEDDSDDDSEDDLGDDDSSNEAMPISASTKSGSL